MWLSVGSTSVSRVVSAALLQVEAARGVSFIMHAVKAKLLACQIRELFTPKANCDS